MLLFESFMESCTLMVRTRTADDEGGQDAAWQPGASFIAATVRDSSLNATVAEAQGVTDVYTVTTERGVGLKFHDAFMRDSDGKTFRVTQVLNSTPAAASFQFDQYRAEEWELA